MPRMRWMEEKLAELRRRMNLEQTYAEIGAALGCTENAARVKAYKLGWSSHDHAGFLRWRRRHETKRTAEQKAHLSAVTKARWQDPAYRERVVPIIVATNQQPARCRKISRAQDRRRGFAIPADMRAEYDHLQNNKGFDAREAGRILGLIPQPATEKLNGTCSA